MKVSTPHPDATRASRCGRAVVAALMAGLLAAVAPARADDGATVAATDGALSAKPAAAGALAGEAGVASLVRQVPASVKGAWQSVAQGVADVPAEWSVIEQGTASFLWNGLNGRRTASGERYNMNELTAAHKTLPFGTQVIVRSLDTGREVLVRIIDRGPHLKDRVIDLSRAAAKALGIQSRGVSEVQVIAVPSAP